MGTATPEDKRNPRERVGSGEAARYLGLSPGYFANCVKAGLIRPVDAIGVVAFGGGGRHVFTIGELDRFRRSRRPRGGGYDPEVWKDWARLRKRILAGRLTHREAAEKLGVAESSVSRRLAKEARQAQQAQELLTPA